MTQIPLQDGYLSEHHVIIKNCSFCGRVHHHGRDPDSKIGDIYGPKTRECEQAQDLGFETWAVKIVGTISTQELRKLESRKLPSKQKTPLKFINYTDSKGWV